MNLICSKGEQCYCFLSFFLLCQQIHCLVLHKTPCFDSSGEKLQTGVDYYILQAVSGSGGGLTLGRNSNGSNCPLDVVQEQSNGSNGLPLMFSSVNPNEGVVRLLTDQNVKFSAATICVQSTVWKLAPSDVLEGRFVTTGGVEGNPGRATLSNWFRIEKYDDDYKMMFCAHVCGVNEGCKVLCGDLGIFVDNDGTRRLALSEQPLKVVFNKA
ncbi:kunitz trypsin inhibitor 5-like [Cornus florida]|uniref:kunitz trypsin inhibitor 5-like n=1 Tax=Cornus florida TaxID=4283 RepID=UPI002899CF45|nr:kunitz trypsin inhibitor 5-like [Cornus florida]